MHVISAIFRRNFVSYFSNPTGYVFIFVFAMLGGFAAFFPHAFWNSNLANLDQLNYWFPFIMLAFAPAISMSVWSEERRQGTDELLLTIPATDAQVVTGKYLSTVAIFTVSLSFSFLCNLIVLSSLGNPDFGQFLMTYFGYWLIGWMMLAIGCVASFLTANLTVSYVLAAIFNAPLVMLAAADAIPWMPSGIRRWSVSDRLADFGNGILSFANLVYFVGITALALYLCMILIGRRHWLGGPKGSERLMHFTVRAIGVALFVIGMCIFFTGHDLVRADITAERLSSLSPETLAIIKNIPKDRPIRIDAYMTREEDIPESYVQARRNLSAVLREFQSVAGNKLIVNIQHADKYSDELERANELYGIKPQQVDTTVRGARTQQEVVLGIAFTSGREQAVVPFVGKALPVEYEVARSLALVSNPKKKRLGLVKTDLNLASSTGQNAERAGLLSELKKQYEVIDVDPKKPIERFDVLIALQPSSLNDLGIQNLVKAIQSNQPALIFEDPFPSFFREIIGTDQPKMPNQQAMMMGQMPEPKGNIRALWQALEVDFEGSNVTWHAFNPFPSAKMLDLKEWVYTGTGSDAAEPFNAKDPAVSGLQVVLLPFPGSIRKLRYLPTTPGWGLNGLVSAADDHIGKFLGKLDLIPLVMTGNKAGTISVTDVQAAIQERNERLTGMPEFGPYERHAVKPLVLASRIRTKESDKDATDKPDKKAVKEGSADAKKPEGLDVILIADVDMVLDEFFSIRSQGNEYLEDRGIHLDVDNVVFILNAIDELAGEQRFIDIRKRRRVHRTLTSIDNKIGEGKQAVSKIREKSAKDLKKAEDDEKKAFEEEAKPAKKELENLQTSYEEKANKIQGEIQAEALALQDKYAQKYKALPMPDEKAFLALQSALQDEMRDLLDPERSKFKDRIAELNGIEQKVESLSKEVRDLERDGFLKLKLKADQQKKSQDREINQAEKNQAVEVRSVQDRYKAIAILLPPLLPLALALIVFIRRRAGETEGVDAGRLV